MGISTNAKGVGSLMHQNEMENVNDEMHMELEQLNNGINTVELIFNNTQQAQVLGDDLSSQQQQQPEIQQIQHLSNTITNQSRNNQDFIDLLQLGNNSHYHQTLGQSHQQQHQTSAYFPREQQQQNNNNQPLLPNIINTTGRLTYQDNMEDYGYLFESMPEDEQHVPIKSDISPSGGDDDLNTPQFIVAAPCDNYNLDHEETYEITFTDQQTILSSTQEIIFGGINTEEDWTGFDQNDATISANDTGFVDDEYNISDIPVDIQGLHGDLDPMLSVGIKNENAEIIPDLVEQDEVDGSFDDADMKDVNDVVVELLNDPKYQLNESSVPRTPARKSRHHHLNVKLAKNNTSDEGDVKTADILDSLMSFEIDLGVNNTAIILPSTSTYIPYAPSTPPSSRLTQYEDITQSSVVSAQDDSRFDDFSDLNSTAPSTPFSCFSYATASTSRPTTSAGDRKRRGRPPKTQSQQPDPKQLEKLSPSQRKYILQRCKNNEASRQSRLNRKTKQDHQKEEEQMLAEDNDRLKRQAAKWEKTEETLKSMLYEDIKQRR